MNQTPESGAEQSNCVKSEEALRESERHLRSIVDGLLTHIAVLDDQGEIIFTNKSYRDFGARNGVEPSAVSEGTNYLSVCDSASGEHSGEAKPFAKGIREVLSGKRPSFELEYPCHSPDGKRWFIGRVTPFSAEGPSRVIVAHENITERKRAEEAMRASEKLLIRAQEIANAGSWKLDLASSRLTWSDEVYRIFGCKPQEFAVTYETFLDFIHPDDRAAVDEAYSLSQREGRDFYEIEHRIVRKNSGEVRYVHERCVHERADSGTIIQSIGMVQDITERKQTENYREMRQEILQILNEPGDLREAIQRLLNALKLQTGADAVGLRLQDGEDFPYFVQEGFSQDFLLTENTLVERGKDGDVCRDRDGKVCLECTCGLVLSGKTDPSNPLFTKGGSCWTNDSLPLLHWPSDQDPRLHSRNNCIHQGYASVALIPIRTSDRIVGLIQLNDKRKGRFNLEMIQILEGIAAHIGSAMMRKRAETELHKSEALFRNVFEILPVGLWLADKNGKLIQGNPAGVAIWGAEPKVAPDQYGVFKARRLPSGEELSPTDWALARTIKEGETIVDELLEIDAFDGKRKTILNYTKPILATDGAIEGAIVVNLDVSDRLALEAQLQHARKMESIGRLAGGVAHDFNNLLMGIMGYVDLCREDIATDHPIREWLDEIKRGAERSADLTRQLLAFARKQTIAPKVLDLNDAVARMLKMLRQLTGEDIAFSWQPGAGLWSVKMDPGQIDQILANLCVNARDAIDGVGKLTIETENAAIDANYCEEHAEATPGSYVTLVVSDDGCGMDKETLAQVFDPFFTTKGVGEGTGLGLATVYGIVKQNGGFVNVYSEPGHGTTFRIYLPRFVGEQTILKEAVTTGERPGGSETIMLVEDEKGVRVTTALFLEKLGYTVLSAETPSTALRMAAEHEGAIELLITDVIMPGMNGRDLASELSGKYPRMKSLFISGYTANVIAHCGILDNDVKFLSKPFRREELAQKLREMLKSG